ncbi:hypothetical protein [Mucilaginibacter antarcticus]|uniref:Uncharacterized protein n=1 Tax=Mucilaginibacter antarcticus TaxID=1855725 RepID=A0ABW5XJS7_9SPHI
MKKLMTSPDRSTKIILVIFLLLMIASTFIGIPLNGGDKGWIYVYDGELGLFTYTILGSSGKLWRDVLLAIQVITHMALFTLPFLLNYKRFTYLLVSIPLLYLLLQALTFYYLLILLIPFMILWAMVLIAWIRRDA